MNLNTVDENFMRLKNLLTPQKDFNSITNVLKCLTRLMQSPDSRKLLTQNHWEVVTFLTNVGSQTLSKSNNGTEELEFVAEVFRFLRNSCGGFAENQLFVLSSQDIINFAKKPLQCLLHMHNAEEITILKICIQLFGNILLCNDSSKPIVWKIFFEENIFKELLNCTDPTVVDYTMMVLYNCMSDENCKCLFNTNEGHDVIVAITNTLLRNNTDWGMLFMEYALKRKEFLECCYKCLPLENKLLILEIISEHMKYTENEEHVFIPISSINYVKNLFLIQVEEIARLSNMHNSDLDPSEFVRMLSLLCSASVCNAYIPFMLSNKDLLGKCIETLKCIHLLGKQGGNAFSSVCPMTQANSQFNEQMACHPLYGFKKDLIRIIGNLCYGCKENQDLVRKLDGIPLVLDCCKLDAKNPYIMQWCILAIRNILENNQENKDILASITSKGEVVDSELLKEMGIQICVKDGKLTLN